MQALFDVSSYKYVYSQVTFMLIESVFKLPKSLYRSNIRAHTLNIVWQDITTNIQNIFSDWYTLNFQKYMTIRTVITWMIDIFVYMLEFSSTIFFCSMIYI